MFLSNAKKKKNATFCVINVPGTLAVLRLQLHKIENEPSSDTGF